METPAFLLTMPMYDGTLAAARCLGQRGIPVTLAGDRMELSAPARWSKYVTRWENSPSALKPTEFIDWLLAFGRKNPRHVLYPTSDDLAWLFAEHASELRAYFYLYQPDSRTLLRLLDKKTLRTTCEELGIATPPTLFPTDAREAKRDAELLGFPVLLKPRTQVLQRGHGKGHIVKNVAELERFFDSFRGSAPHQPRIRQHIPDVHLPMVQQYREGAAERVYSISGILTHDGELVVRAARKVLQRPRRVGVGICFEEAPVEPQALADVLRLCRTVGYHGVFEVEFLQHDGRLELIDFNPRFYGQMGFDIGRQLPLPYLIWLGAQQRSEELRAELLAAQAWQGGEGYVYCNGFSFGLVRMMQRMSGRMTPSELERWAQWLQRSRERATVVDAMRATGDQLPGVVSAFREVTRALRHPRDFYRQVIVGSVLAYFDCFDPSALLPLLSG